MTTDEHITREVASRLLAGELEAGEAERARSHASQCPECTALLESASAFLADIDATWNRDQLRAMGAGHPSASLLEAMWLGQHVEAVITDHVQNCEVCARYLSRLQEALDALEADDPLSRTAWAALITQRFAVGIEVLVEAATGAFTSAAGLAHDVMPEQTIARLAPVEGPTVPSARKAGALWHAASFQTNTLSGEIRGATHPQTGRGIITVQVHKSGEFVATPPIVVLVNAAGKALVTQAALDIGDRFSAVFENVDHGRYLVAIRTLGDKG